MIQINRIIEEMRPGGVRMITIREKTGVRYQVFDTTGRMVWDRFLKFGRGPRSGAGGSEFRAMATEQERIAAITG